jgi:hypothetical protein
LGLFSIMQAEFVFDLGGEVQKGVSVTVLDLELVKSEYQKEDGTIREYGTAADVVRMSLEGLVVIGVGFQVLGELKDLRDAKKTLGKYRFYFASPWNFVDMAHITLYVFVILYWLVMFQAAAQIVPPQYFDWSDPEKLKELLDTTNDIMRQSAFFSMYRVLCVTSCTDCAAINYVAAAQSIDR